MPEDRNRHAFELGWVLFVATMACLLPAIVLGLSKSGRPIYEPARDLAIPGGLLALLYAALVATRRARWIGLFADEPHRVARVLGCIGLASVGAALDGHDSGTLWRLLMLPACLLLCATLIGQGVRGRGWWLEQMPWWRPVTRGFFVLFGLMLLGVGVPWILGIIEVD